MLSTCIPAEAQPMGFWRHPQTLRMKEKTPVHFLQFKTPWTLDQRFMRTHVVRRSPALMRRSFPIRRSTRHFVKNCSPYAERRSIPLRRSKLLRRKAKDSSPLSTVLFSIMLGLFSIILPIPLFFSGECQPDIPHCDSESSAFFNDNILK